MLVLMCVCIEVCPAAFTDLESLMEHVWTCDMRSKFMDKNSDQLVCLECGKLYKQEKSMYNHVQKHCQVCLLSNVLHCILVAAGLDYWCAAIRTHLELQIITIYSKVLPKSRGPVIFISVAFSQTPAEVARPLI